MKLVELKTIQVSTFRILFEALKEILLDISIEFTPDAIKINRMDTARTLMVDLHLNTENLEYYNCEKKVNLGLNMMQLFKIIKTCSVSDILTIIYDDDDESVVTILIENEEKNTHTKYNLNLIEINRDEASIPEKNFDSIVNIPTVDFQKIIKDMKQFSEFIDIKCCKNELVFSCNGDFTSRETRIQSNELESTITFLKENNSVIQGVYNGKYLLSFIKCTNLCHSLQMKFANDYPLLITYPVGNLGTITFFLAQHIGEEN